jgi:hypothetical protein
MTAGIEFFFRYLYRVAEFDLNRRKCSIRFSLIPESYGAVVGPGCEARAVGRESYDLNSIGVALIDRYLFSRAMTDSDVPGSAPLKALVEHGLGLCIWLRPGPVKEYTGITFLF